MSRTTKVVGFSLPPETHKKVEKLIKSEHKTRSEFFRALIDMYLESKKPVTIDPSPLEIAESETDIATILKSYWNLRSETKSKVIPIGLAIIVDKTGKVLIGARAEKDKWVENLSWVFPGGRNDSLDFEKGLRNKVKETTNLDVKVNTIVSSRVHPGSGFKDVQIVALYFYCSVKSKKGIKPGGELSKLKWVKPTHVFKYFTTSTSDDVTKFLISIEKGA